MSLCMYVLFLDILDVTTSSKVARWSGDVFTFEQQSAQSHIIDSSATV
jgi:hypothetical protein